MRPEFLAAFGLLLREAAHLSGYAKPASCNDPCGPDLVEEVAEEVASRVAGAFSLQQLALTFLLGLLVGIGVGLLLGKLCVRDRRRSVRSPVILGHGELEE